MRRKKLSDDDVSGIFALITLIIFIIIFIFIIGIIYIAIVSSISYIILFTTLIIIIISIFSINSILQGLEVHPIIAFIIPLILFISLFHTTPILSDYVIDSTKDKIIVGDKLLITGVTNNFETHDLTFELNDNSKNSSKETVQTHTGKFNAILDTSSLQGGNYNLVIKNSKKTIETRTINIINTNIENVVITPSYEFTYGISPQVIAIFRNSQAQEKNFEISLILDGKLISSKKVNIKPNTFQNVEFTIDKPSAGEHNIIIGGRQTSFKVLPEPYLRLEQINKPAGIGNPLTIIGHSNLNDGTEVLVTIQSNNNILDKKNTTIKNSKFSVVFDTSNAKETIYTVSSKTQTQNSNNIEVALIKLTSQLEITDVSLSETTAIIGTPIKASVSVINNGNIEGSKDIIIYIDGSLKKRHTITIKPNEIKQVIFNIEENVGDHEIIIEKYTKKLTIKPTPNIIIDTIKDTQIGNTLTITGKTNMPDGVSILITAVSGSSQLAPKTVISQDGKFSASFDTNNVKEGIYHINARSVGGTSSDIISVMLYNSIPDIALSLGISQKEINIGNSLKVMVTLTTTSQKPIDKILELKMDGNSIETKTVTVDKIKLIEFIIQNPSAGTHIIDVNGYQTQFLVSEIKSTSDISFHLRTDTKNMNVGEEVPLTLSATNILTKPPMTVQLILTIPSGMSITSSEFSTSGVGQYSSIDYNVESGKTRYIGANIKANDKGIHKIEGRIVYYFGNNITDKKDEIQTLYITVNEPENQNEESVFDKLINFLKI